MPSSDVADVLIIGSGASGGPFAWHLSKMSGVKIVCLEQGDWVGKASAVGTEAAGQRERLTTPPPRREGVRSFADGYSYDFTNSTIGAWPVLGNHVGGATIHYAAIWARMHPGDFLARTLDGVADDWPIGYRELAPYYDQIDAIVGVSGVPGNPAYPPTSVPLQPAPNLSADAKILSGGLDKLGWHWWPMSRAIITVPHGGRRPCPTHCSACDKGCPREAKNSTDVVFWPEAIKNGVELRTRARVREITVNSKGLADGVVYYDADGRVQTQRARIVVVACNGIGTPRLLLNSKSKLFPAGLANSSGMVGKCLMGHPTARVSGTTDNPAPVDQTAAGLASDEFYENNLRHGFARGMWLLSGGVGAPIQTALNEGPEPTSAVIPAALRPGLARTPIPWGALHHAAFQQRFQRTVGVTAFADELPSERNRVELDPSIADNVGIPGVKLHYTVGENTQKALTFGMARMRDACQAAGLSDVQSNLATAAPGHYLGTARMGADPNRSVVDGNNRAHDVRNLFIIDGSVFTTGGSVPPTSTIQAIALRAADYLTANARKLFV